MTGSFTLAYVPGVTPGKWARVWQERLPETPLVLVQVTAAEAAAKVRSGEADAALLRLPGDREDLHAIPLYTETTVVVHPKDQEFADELSVDDLAGHVLWQPLDDTLGWESVPGQPPVERPETTADAVEVVAAGVGLLVVPQSLARLHHRRDLAYKTLADAPQSRVALSFPIRDENPELVEHLIGIVRGRTVNSTRGPRQEPERKPRQEPARKQQQQRGAAPRQQQKPPAKRAKTRRGR
ncbi:substrate-binding domain-containing protein [Lentzea sp. NPDC060358]|uniref:substrate-binding domain-containing protein n=1 Tax=Lentzea sp. NPDC060358 TaxID=3347103 RepID=UPI003663E759